MSFEDRYYKLGELSFPRSGRTYFDPESHEYGDITLNQKLLDIAYMLVHGYDVNEFIHKTFSSAASPNTDTLKRGIVNLLAELWGGTYENTYYMYRHKTIDTVIKDLFTAVLRYYHVPTTEDETHYLKDPQFMTKEEFTQTNPWLEIANQYLNPRILLSDKEYVLRADRKMIEEFNQTAKNEDVKYNLHLPVYPWYGNPLTTKVIVLSQNPAWNEKQDEIAKVLQCLPDKQLKLFSDHLRDMLKFKVDGFLPSKEETDGISGRVLANLHMSWYWENKLKSAFGESNLETVISKFAIIQYIGYSSKKFQAFKGEKCLPSQNFTKQLIQFILHNNDDAVFIVPRNIERWKNFLGTIWTSNKEKFIEGKAYRSQSLNAISGEDKKKVMTAFGIEEN